MLKTISPSIPKAELWGGFRWSKMQKSENLPNGWNDWHQIWYTSADSSRNGHRLKTISPSIHQGAFGGGGVRGKTFKSLENLPNGWTDWHQIWYTSADSYGNGHRRKTNIPSSPGFILRFRWSKCNQKFEECHDLQRKNENKLYKNEMHT